MPVLLNTRGLPTGSSTVSSAVQQTFATGIVLSEAGIGDDVGQRQLGR